MTALIVLLLVVGFVLLAVEVLVIPGFGVAGISGILSLVAGTALSWKIHGALWGLSVASGTVLASLGLLWLVAKTRVGRSIALNVRLEGTTADESLSRLVGKTGESLSILRPSGTALIDGERYGVLTEGLFLEKGTALRVVRVDAGRLVVEPIEGQAAEPADDRDTKGPGDDQG